MARFFANDSTKYLSLGSALLTATPFTVAAWVYPTNNTNSQNVFSVGAAGTNYNEHFLGLAASTGQVSAASRDGSTTAGATSPFSALPDAWTHICGVWKAVDDRRAYCKETEGTNTTSKTVTGLSDTYIGRRTSTSSQNPFSGRIAHVAVWNTDLTKNEIDRLQKGVSPFMVRPENLIAYWPLYGSASPEVDLAGDVKNLTLNGSPPPSQVDHVYLPPPFGFDYSQSYIIVGGGAQNVYPSSITSGEAFGSLTVLPGAATLTPNGIVSGEAFGSLTVLPGTVNILPSGIASIVVFGTPLISVGKVIVTPSGIGSSEVFGTLTIVPGKVIVSPAGIGSGEAFGALSVIPGAVTLAPSSVTSGEVLGTPVILPGVVILIPSGIESAQVLGTPKLNLSLYPAGIPPPDAYGNPKINLNIQQPAGISSQETFGTPVLTVGAVSILPVSISSGEALGTPLVYHGPQKARPDSDISNEGWTDQGGGSSNLYQVIDEITPDDNDYARSAVSPTNDILEVGLSNINDPGTDTGHKARYRYRKDEAGGLQINLTVYLMQGTTTIAYWTHNNIGVSWITVEQDLTIEQAGNITNYSDLRYRFVANEV